MKVARTLWCATIRRRGALTKIGILITLVLVVVVMGGRWPEFAKAASGVSPWLLVAAAAIHVLSLVSRSEGWLLCIRAAGGTAPRRRVYRAASIGYVGNVVNGELGFALRIAALRRSSPEQVPRAAPLAASEVPMFMVDATLASLTSFTLVGPLDLPWFSPLLLFGAMLAAMAGLSRLPRHRGTGWRSGLAILTDVRASLPMAALVLVSILCQIARNWLMLRAAGVDASVFDATAVLIALAVLSVLPLGPSVTAAAAVLILGAHGTVAVSTAGVMLTLTAAIGALAYAAWTLVDLRWRARGAAARVPRAPLGRPARAPAGVRVPVIETDSA